MKSAILLLRVSTLVQDYNAQKTDLENYAKDKGYNRLHIIETKESGFNDFKNRIGATELFNFINQNPEYDTVIVTELSRLGRSSIVLGQFRNLFIERKIQLLVKDTGLRLLDDNKNESATGNLMFTIYGAFAESEMSAKKDRFLRKRKDLMQHGVSISGPVLFGYKKIKQEQSKRQIHAEHDENSRIVRTIFQLYLNGEYKGEKNLSIKKIAQICIKDGYPKYTHSKRNINKLLKEEGYTGFKTTPNGNGVKYPPIISKDLFDSVQKKMMNKIQLSRNSKNTTLLAGLIACPECQRKLSANYRLRNGSSNNSYRCTSRTDAVVCKFKTSISMSLIDSAVWAILKSKAQDLFHLINLINPSEELLNINSQLLNIEKKISQTNTLISNKAKSLEALANVSIESMDSIIEKEGKKLKSLRKKTIELEVERTALMQEKIRFENFDSSEDYRTIFIKQIQSSEQNASELKSFINHFIESIQIINHQSSITDLLIQLKEFEFKPNLIIEKLVTKNKFIYLRIEKTVTQQPRLFIHEKYLSKNTENFKNYIVKLSNLKDRTGFIEIPFERLNKIYSQ